MGFPPEIFVRKSSFCSNVPYTFIYTLLSADNRTTRHHLCDLLLKNEDFRTKSSGGNPIWGQNFSKFSLPKTCPHHGERTGEKKILHKYYSTALYRIFGKSLVRNLNSLVSRLFHLSCCSSDIYEKRNS